MGTEGLVRQKKLPAPGMELGQRLLAVQSAQCRRAAPFHELTQCFRPHTFWVPCELSYQGCYRPIGCRR